MGSGNVDPRSDVTSKTARLTYAIVFLVLLLAASIIITFFSSKYCISPLMEAISKIKQNESQEKTNISEIDDLIEYLMARAEPAVAIDGQTGFTARNAKKQIRRNLPPTKMILHPNRSSYSKSSSKLLQEQKEGFLTFISKAMMRRRSAICCTSA